MGEEDQRFNGSLAGQVAIVTGGGSGIGRAACHALLRAGARVVVVDRSRSRVDEVLAELERICAEEGLPGETLGLALDVRSEADMNEMALQTVQRFGRIDILIASAGILRGEMSTLKLMAQMDPREWDEVIDVNLKGVFLSNRAVLPIMMEQNHGQIINISSTSGRQGRAFDTAYCASKFGVIGLTESAAQEVSRYGVRMNVLLPDMVDTPIWEQNQPVPRPADMLPPERVASVILYMLTLPEDTLLLEPVVAPFRAHRRPPRQKKAEGQD